MRLFTTFDHSSRLAALVGTAAFVLAGAGLVSGCDTKDSKTELNPEGPPMILQVFVQERVTVTNEDGSTSTRTRTQLAFGDHPDIPQEDDNRVVDNALARGSQKLRIVVDELLDGSALEQVACADGTFSDIPSNVTPDDIANCAGVDLSQCSAVCIGGSGPIGILDEDEDGAADNFRLKDGSVQIVCGGEAMPLDLDNSFYNPSGNQQIPAGDIGVNGLGPAVVLTPIGLRTGSSCTIQFDPAVQDKDGTSVCAPQDGSIEAGCAPGDTSLITFGVQPFLLLGTDPDDGATGVPTTSAQILLQYNQAVDPSTLTTGLEVTEDGTDVAFTASVSEDDPTIVTVLVTGGFASDTDYCVRSVAGTLLETFGGTLAEDALVCFTTGTAAPTPDAAPPPPDAAGSPDADTTPDAGA